MRANRRKSAFSLAALLAAPPRARLHMTLHGAAVMGKKIASIVKDDTGAAEVIRPRRIEVSMTMRSRRIC